MILAAGEGTRLRPLTETVPKPMIPIANIPLLERTLRWLAGQGVSGVAINLHSHPQAIRDSLGDGQRLGIRYIHYSYEPALLGTAGAVKNCQGFFGDDPFIVIYGDNLIEADLQKLLSFHKKREAQVTVALFTAPDPSACGLVETSEDGRITRFTEKPAANAVFTSQANAGVYVLAPSVLESIAPGMASDFARDIFPALLAAGGRLFATPLSGYLRDTGTPQQYRQANADVLLGKVPNVRGTLIKNPPNYTLIAEGAQIAPSVRFRGFNVIGQAALIEENAQLTDCILWDRAEVGARSKLTRAILGRGARVAADGSPPDDLILGKDALWE
jgi:NDP-sugar pyrophosphorylase family protein